MTVQETIEQLKRIKTSHSTEELDRLGWSRYGEIQSELEQQHYGDYVMIEVDSGDYFVRNTAHEALHWAEAVYSSKAFCLIQIGYKAVHKMAQKAKRYIPLLDPDASYETKARYYERFSTNELVVAGHLDEVGVCQHAPKRVQLNKPSESFIAFRKSAGILSS